MDSRIALALKQSRPHEFVVVLAGSFVTIVRDDIRIPRSRAHLDALFCWFQGVNLCDYL